MTSKYARSMAKLSARIFVENSTPTDPVSMKVVKIFSGVPPHLDPQVVKYYPRLKEMKQLTEGMREHGLFKDFHMDFKEALIERRAARGKVKKVPWHVQKRLAKEAEQS